LPRGLQENSETTRQAPELYDISPAEVSSDDDVVERVSIFNAEVGSSGGSLVSSSGDSLMGLPPPEKRARISPGLAQGKDKSGEMMVDFLRANGSPTADEASCLASGSLDEAPSRTGNITPVTRYLAREASGAQSSVTTSEVLGSLEEEGFAVRGRHTVSRRLAQRANLPYLS